MLAQSMTSADAERFHMTFEQAGFQLSVPTPWLDHQPDPDVEKEIEHG